MIVFIMLFWDTNCQVRKRNAIVSWNELKKMVSYMKSNGIDCDHKMFEFGKDFIFEDSIKIEMDIDYFEKSKKVNIALNHPCIQSYRLCGLFDCDLFFKPDQYDQLINHINSLFKEITHMTFNLWDVSEQLSEEIILNYEIDYSKVHRELTSSRHSCGYGTLGGFFIADLNALKEVGGFNEKFRTWGAEDDEANVRLKAVSRWKTADFFGPYHLYHPKDEQNSRYFIPVFSEEYFQINDVNRTRVWSSEKI